MKIFILNLSERKMRSDSYKAILKNLCPNCWSNDVGTERLLQGLPCHYCYPEDKPPIVVGILSEGVLKQALLAEAEVENWKLFFKEKIGSNPTSLQCTWLSRVFLSRSFAIIAPTGIGKTTFGLITAAYLASKGWKSYLIFPTKILVEQAKRKLSEIGFDESLVLSFENINKEKKRRLASGDYQILITTSMFLYKNFSAIPRNFRFIFVDDVDSFLKTAKNVDAVFLLMGYTEEELKLAYEALRLKNSGNKDENALNRLKEIKDYLQKKRPATALTVSSATARPKSKKIQLFKELLNFEVGTPNFTVRNVLDLKADYGKKELFEILRILENGILLFVSSDLGKGYVEELKKELKSKGFKAISYLEISEENIELFLKGEVQIIIGISSYRNPLARGLDLPQAVKFAVFYGVPKIVIDLNIEDNPTHLLWLLGSLRPLIVRKFPEQLKKVDSWLNYLKKVTRRVNQTFSTSRFEQVKREVAELLKNEKLIQYLETSDEVSIRKEEGQLKLVVSDATGYLQASGRTSRLWAGGLTKGLSIVLVDDKKAFKHLERRLRFLNAEVEFKDLNRVDLLNLANEISAERGKIKMAIEEKKKVLEKDFIKPTLMVVESPNKARTIAGFFGKPLKRVHGGAEVYEIVTENRYLMITASLGHILDLILQGGIYGVYKDNSNFIPVYEPLKDRDSLIRGVQELSSEVKEILIATDPDAEGEKIAYDLMCLLTPFSKEIRRAEFHEITRRAVRESLENPGSVDLNRVKAQAVRRIADRWVGFKFSEYLWEKFNEKNLSAGRVQTPVLGWIIEREKQLREKIYVVQVYLRAQTLPYRLDFSFESYDEAKSFYNQLESVAVSVIREYEDKVFPLPPYCTDTMLKDANRYLNYSLEKTMSLAQDLFELGYITYHRTDSIRVSSTGQHIAREFISEAFGEDFYHGRTWSDEGAHECIRPTKALSPDELYSYVATGQAFGLTYEHAKLYQIIFKRFMASQMVEAIVRKKVYEVVCGIIKKEIELIDEIVRDGWSKLYHLPVQKLEHGKTSALESKKLKKVPKAWPFTQGEIVELMKERKIGRPSTYAVILQKLLNRGYIIEKNGRIRPTKLGMRVYEELSKNRKASVFLIEDFTRELEKKMDEIEDGKLDYQTVLKSLYKQVFSGKE